MLTLYTLAGILKAESEIRKALGYKTYRFNDVSAAEIQGAIRRTLEDEDAKEKLARALAALSSHCISLEATTFVPKGESR